MLDIFDFKSFGAISSFLAPHLYAACLSDCVNNSTFWRQLLSPLRTLGAKLANSSTSQNPSCNTAKLVTAGDSDCVVMMVSGMMLMSLVIVHMWGNNSDLSPPPKTNKFCFRNKKQEKYAVTRD